MKLSKNKVLLGLAVLLPLGIGGYFVGRHQYELYLLQGQAPSEERLVETSTGGDPHYDPIQYRAKDSRPAVVEPEFIAASEAKIAGGTMGIGVSVNDDSRFYPLYVLQYHQIVNDTCGGKAVACTY
ncbi:MAG TPA: DUF3179 domain-containing protein [Planctomycetes bacterium]|nr:DUF3179 domain-containing protein [Planctomycetota bacterium]